MTAEQIQQIKEKYKNPLYMKQAINKVADNLADEYVRQGLKIELKEKPKMADVKTRIKELEDVLLNQIEMLNDESILTDKEAAMLQIEKSKAISDLTKNYTEIQKTKLDIVKVALHDGSGYYDKYLGIE